MDEIILQPEDASETSETRRAETESLDEATFEPRAHVERTGDYKQSEAIQTAFESVTTNAAENDKVETAPPKEEETGGDEPQGIEPDKNKAGQRLTKGTE
ncbi:MAG: hypothetical protein JW730_11085 [Anaerolineales bacterium]|nr:hypothetical protein [Anaerolineales bacterium]